MTKHNYHKDDPFDIDPVFRHGLAMRNTGQMAGIDEENDITMSELADVLELEGEIAETIGEEITVDEETRPEGAVGEPFAWIAGNRERHKARKEGRLPDPDGKGDSDQGYRSYDKTPTSAKYGGTVTRHVPESQGKPWKRKRSRGSGSGSSRS